MTRTRPADLPGLGRTAPSPRGPTERTGGLPMRCQVGYRGGRWAWAGSLARLVAAAALLLVAVLVPQVGVCAPPEAVALPAATTTSQGDKPIDVRVTLWLLDIAEIDMQTSTFQLDATLELRWTDPRFVVGEVPPFEIMNAIDTRLEFYPTPPSGEWQVRNWRIHAKMRAHFDLHRYPFDVQRLEVRLEHPLLQADQLRYHCETRFHPEPGVTLQRRLGPDFNLSDWQLRNVSSKETIVTYGPQEPYSRYTMTVEVQRELLRALVAEFAPLLLMVLLSLAASGIPPEKLDGKLLLTVLSLLVAVELQVAAQDHIPALGYLTVIDWAYLCAYASIATGVVQTILEYRQHAMGHDDWALVTKWRGTLISALVFFLPVVSLLVWHGIQAT